MKDRMPFVKEQLHEPVDEVIVPGLQIGDHHTKAPAMSKPAPPKNPVKRRTATKSDIKRSHATITAKRDRDRRRARKLSKRRKV